MQIDYFGFVPLYHRTGGIHKVVINDPNGQGAL